jgi:hypothetical protein
MPSLSLPLKHTTTHAISRTAQGTAEAAGTLNRLHCHATIAALFLTFMHRLEKWGIYLSHNELHAAAWSLGALLIYLYPPSESTHLSNSVELGVWARPLPTPYPPS